MLKSISDEFDCIDNKIDSPESISGGQNNDETCAGSDVRAIEQIENNHTGDGAIENSTEPNAFSVGCENKLADVEEGGDFDERFDVTEEITKNSNETDYNHFQTDISEIISKLIPNSDAEAVLFEKVEKHLRAFCKLKERIEEKRRNMACERNVSVTLASGFLILSLLIYTTFLLMGDPFKNHLVNACRSLLGHVLGKSQNNHHSKEIPSPADALPESENYIEV